MTPGQAWRVEAGDCLEVLERMAAESVDAVVTDPPYGLSREPDMAEVLRHWLAGDDYHHRGGGFMGQAWDSFVPGPAVWRECLRVLKPGGHLLAFGGTRTADLLATAVRLAGFEIRDRVLTLSGHEVGPELDWLYGSGWPKSLNVSKSIDRAAGAEREVVGPPRGLNGRNPENHAPHPDGWGGLTGRWAAAETAPATPDAERWEGWGTALKPAHEPVVVARKPMRGNVTAQVLATGTGALNIDGCRVDTGGEEVTAGLSDPANRRGVVGQRMQASGDAERNQAAQRASLERANAMGRWPANVVLLHAPACERAGVRRVPTGTTVRRNLDPDAMRPGSVYGAQRNHQELVDVTYGDGDGRETVEAWRCAPGCPVAELDAQGGELRSGDPTAVGDPAGRAGQNAYMGESRPAGTPIVGYGDRGGASRFFYQAKASPAERDFGLEDTSCEPTAYAKRWTQTVTNGRTEQEYARTSTGRNPHPTVKPIDLMRWLVRLVAPPGGVVVDPFCGSGTTGCAAALEGVAFVGIERDERFAEIARRRVEAWARFPPGTDVERVLAVASSAQREAQESEELRRALASAGQLDLLAGAEG